jgi:branched-chain amino acid transport system substrate-binding protein
MPYESAAEPIKIGYLATSGPPGIRISFGKWTRRGWMGTGYLVARQLDTDNRLASRRSFGEE